MAIGQTIARIGPDLLDVAVTSVFNPFAGVGLATRKILDKIEEAKQAEKEYLGSPVDAESKLEIERRIILNGLRGLQKEIVQEVFDKNLLRAIWPIYFDQIINTYKATSEQELEVVKAIIGQIQGALKSYYRQEKNRTSARWSAVIVALIAVFGLAVLMIWSFSYPETGPNQNTLLPILNIPLLVVLWSAIGSITAILYRFNISGDVELRDPMRWLFTRPLTGIVMGIVAYLTVTVGLLSMGSGDKPTIESAAILWLVAFLAGFSDRFADSVLKALVGKFGGDKDTGLLSQVPLLSTVEVPFEFHSPASILAPLEPKTLERTDEKNEDSSSIEIQKPVQPVLVSPKGVSDKKREQKAGETKKKPKDVNATKESQGNGVEQKEEVKKGNKEKAEIIKKSENETGSIT